MAKQESASSEEKNSRYSITIKEAAIRALKKIPRSFALKIDQKIQALSIQPRPSGCKKLEGYENIYRIRHSDYRVVYTIDDSEMLVDIIHIGNRQDIYKKL